MTRKVEKIALRVYCAKFEGLRQFEAIFLVVLAEVRGLVVKTLFFYLEPITL